MQNTKRIATIDQWTSAFQMFVAIYTVRFPETAPALVKYSATVHDLAAKNAHWRYYDENFRYLRQKSLFPGMKYTGNCGCRRTTWCVVHFQRLQETTLINNRLSPFQKDFARNFIKAKYVLAVTSNMNVSNVGQPIRLFDVVGPNPPPLHHAPPRHMPLPTPIK